MKKLPDGSRLTYEGLEARYDALFADYAKLVRHCENLITGGADANGGKRIARLEAAIGVVLRLPSTGEYATRLLTAAIKEEEP